ncbi:MAG TPA: (2Fe-2S)-binding protein [Gemmatimonadaceae bacterium]|nr:(2Fe-2S)-binding protein [Gemmatimonadaceae bacterium]
MSQATRCRIIVDGMPLDVETGLSVAAALMNAGLHLRRSVNGDPRAALCGMGICHECRVTIDGEAHQRACLFTVAPDMAIARDE